MHACALLPEQNINLKHEMTAKNQKMFKKILHMKDILNRNECNEETKHEAEENLPQPTLTDNVQEDSISVKKEAYRKEHQIFLSL